MNRTSKSTGYRLADGLIIQRDIRIPPKTRVCDFSGKFFNACDAGNEGNAVMLIGYAKKVYEFNLVGAIIIDELKRGEDEDTIIKKLEMIFGNKYPIQEEFYAFCEKLFVLGLLVAADCAKT